MDFAASTSSAPHHFISGGVAAHSAAGEIVEARRCTVQMQNGFLYLDALASTATALLGHDRPSSIAVDRPGLMRTLSTLHPDYTCIALGTSTETMAQNAQTVAAAMTGRHDARIVNAAAGEPEFAAGIVIAVEDETIGRSGAWLLSPSWRNKPDLIVLGATLAAGEPFAAVLITGHATDRSPLDPNIRDASAPAETLALVQAVVSAVRRQVLIEHGRKLEQYFRDRMNAVQAACKQIAAIRFGAFSAKVSFQPGTSAAQLKRSLCERGVLVGLDSEDLVIRPPLATRPAEIDVISGVLRGVLNGVPTTRISACCAACQDEEP